MLIAAPIWLLALVPWAALVVWMLLGRRDRVGVPFLALWRDQDARPPRTSRAVQAPPLPVVLILLTILLAILAASSPTIPTAAGAAVTILVDRGITMSARDGDAYRYQRAAAMLEAELRGPATVVVIPHRQIGSLADVRSLPPTAVDTSADAAQAAKRLLATAEGPVIVLSDQPVEDDPRLVIVAPQPLPPNTGIAHVAARERPAAQVMVRVSGEASEKRTVVVSSDGQRVEAAVTGTAFIDMPRLGKTIEVALAQGDALSADDRAWLVRENQWPRIEPVAPLPPELARMVETYRKLRPATDGAGAVVSIVDDPAAAAGEAVILAPATVAGGAPAGGVVALRDHPITAGVAWNEILADARLGSAPPAGFTPLVSVGDRVAVAGRDTPRQAWVAIDSPAFPRRADYVVFWSNVFDWLGRGGETFASHPVGLLGEGWQRLTDGPEGTEPGLWPGVYQRGDGTLRAVNAPHVKPPAAPIIGNGRERLAKLAAARTGGWSLAPYLLLAALLCACGAALRWPARRGRRSRAQT